MEQQYVEQFIDELSGHLAVRVDYSGRGMYGSTCVSINVDRDTRFGDVLEAIFEMGMNMEDVDRTQRDEDVELVNAIESFLRSAQTDGMGTGMVLYFPAADTSNMDRSRYQNDEEYDTDESE